MWKTLQDLPAALILIVGLIGLVSVWITLGHANEYLARRRFARLYGCKPAHSTIPYANLTFGLDMMFYNFWAARNHRLLELIEHRFTQFGPTFLVRNFNQRAITTIDRDNVKAVLTDRFYDFELADRKITMGPLLGPGIFTSDGVAWKSSRDLVKPNFDRKQVADLESFERHFQEMIELIPIDGSTVDLQTLFFRLTIDSATEFLFGSSVNSLKSANLTGASSDSAFAVAFNYAQRNAANRIRLSGLVHLYYDPAAKKAIKVCHEFVDKFVDDAIAHRRSMVENDKTVDRSEKYVFLKELAKATTDRYQLRSELLNILLAGRDTTASLLSNMWFMIARRPDIFQKLKAEIVDKLKGEPPTFEQIKSLTYLKHTMQESLRYHPVVPLNGRVAVKDTYLPRGGGSDGLSPIFVPKGTRVFYSVYAMHRREDYYGSDAHEFRPERWETTRQGWHYLPFNGGPRICVGQQYALAEAGYVSARLLQTFSTVESRDPNPWEESLHLTLCSKNGTKVALSG